MTPGENIHFLNNPEASSAWNGNGRRGMDRGPAIRIRDEYGFVTTERIPNAIPVRFGANNIRGGGTKRPNVADKIDTVENIYNIVTRISLAKSEKGNLL